MMKNKIFTTCLTSAIVSLNLALSVEAQPFNSRVEFQLVVEEVSAFPNPKGNGADLYLKAEVFDNYKRTIASINTRSRTVKNTDHIYPETWIMRWTKPGRLQEDIRHSGVFDISIWDRDRRRRVGASGMKYGNDDLFFSRRYSMNLVDTPNLRECALLINERWTGINGRKEGNRCYFELRGSGSADSTRMNYLRFYIEFTQNDY